VLNDLSISFFYLNNFGCGRLTIALFFVIHIFFVVHKHWQEHMVYGGQVVGEFNGTFLVQILKCGEDDFLLPYIYSFFARLRAI